MNIINEFVNTLIHYIHVVIRVVDIAEESADNRPLLLSV